MNQNPPDHISIGRTGEDIACGYLVEKGFKILERNHRKTYGEIDIIAQNKDKTLVFVEVKTLEPNIGGLEPEDNMTWAKLSKFRKICQGFANKNPDLISEKTGWRMDLVAITLQSDSEPTIRHYENV